MMAKGPIRMLYVVGKEFTGFELEALWDDSAFGIKHWHDFSQIALVNLAAFLVSDGAAALTGNIEYVDAGYHIVG
jgi:enoyl-[acyl-carrier-protein] reductase (NADH)